MKMANIKIDLKETLLCMIYDACSLNVWMQSKDGVDGVNKPESILQTFMPELKRKTNVMSFDNPEDFLMKFKEIAEG